MVQINIAPTLNNSKFLLEEHTDVRAARVMLALAKYVPDLAVLPQSGLHSYLQHVDPTNEQSKGSAVVQYSDTGIGRLQIQVMKHNAKDQSYEPVSAGTYQAIMKNCVKSVACTQYRDMDICNCHPELLVQMCEHYKLECTTLKQYIKQRADLIKATGLDKSTFKKLFFSAVLYHPQCTDEQLQHKLNKFNLDQEPELFARLRAEMRTASEHLLGLYPCYTEAAINIKGSEYFNIIGTAFALLVQTAEKRCILALKGYWDQLGVSVGALIHDGLHVDADSADKSHLQPASDYIYEKTGYRVKLEYKDWIPHPAYKQTCLVDDMTDCYQHAHNLLEGRLVQCDKRVWFRDESYQWHSGKDDVLVLLANAVSQMHIFTNDKRLSSVSRNATIQGGIAHKHMVAKELFNTAPINDEFIDQVRAANVGKLCFLNGYWDFDQQTFVREMIDTLARVPYDFPERVQDDIDEVHRRIIAPILGDLQDSMLRWFARGMAGHVQDKAYGMWLGERNSGKSALIGLNEKALGRELVMTLNAETFMIKQQGESDTAKSLGFLLQCEHARLVFTNECEVDGHKKLNGALLKKFASGGDSVTARALYQNACTFKLAGRLCMAANDVPDIAPTDAVQTLDYFQCPRVFVPGNDKRLGTDPNMYMAADDTVKDFCSEPRTRAAFIHILLESYGPKLCTTQMNTMRSDFLDGTDDREKFWEMFEVTKNNTDYVQSSDIQVMVRSESLNVTSRRYNRWLRAEGCEVGARETMQDGKRVRVVKGLKRKREEMQAFQM